MKLKVVIGLDLGGDAKKCSKALTVAVGFPGVVKASFEEDKSKIALEGEGLDPVKLTMRLKRKLGHAELLVVKKADDKDDKGNYKMEYVPVVSSNALSWAYNAPPHNYYYYEASNPHQSSCTIV